MKIIFSALFSIFRIFNNSLNYFLWLAFRAGRLSLYALEWVSADSFIFGTACLAVGFYLYGDKFKPERRKR